MALLNLMNYIPHLQNCFHFVRKQFHVQQMHLNILCLNRDNTDELYYLDYNFPAMTGKGMLARL